MRTAARTERAERVTRCLDGWAYVLTARDATGDPSYVGVPWWADGSAPGKGTPGRTPSGIQDDYLMVERLVAESQSSVIRRILTWRHLAGVEWRPTIVSVTLPGGEVLELPYAEFRDRPPLAYDGAIHRYERIELPWSDCPLRIDMPMAGRIVHPIDPVRWLYNRFRDVVASGHWRRR